MARCSLEASARGYWLLDPGIGIEERLRRGAQYYAHCLAEVRKTVNTAPQGALDAELSHLTTRGKEILDWARCHKLTDKERPKEFADSCKGFTDLVSDLLGDMTEGGNVAPMVYRWLSGSAHSNPIVLQEFGKGVEFRGDEQNILRMRASSGTAWFPIWWAARGLQTALARLANVSGWESPDHFLSPAVAVIGRIVDSDIELTEEQVDRPMVYREYLGEEHCR